MFKKVLVANRGEIALRVMRTCRELGIATVAVYSDVDRNALHVRYADEAFLLGPGPPRESYLNVPKVVQAAREAKADAVHPGYGFLSENGDFAQACKKAKIAFIGPTPEAMRLLGDKVAARKRMRDAGVPVVPGTDGEVEPEEARRVAEEIGYPVLIKAAAGGGGKGIRVVREDSELESAVRVASSEAASAFGHGGVYVEKFLSPVRHIEVQIIADKHGNAVALGERECSIQRRHQKLVEESPSMAVDDDLRQRMMAAAVAGAQAAGYQNAGTVEFLLDADGNFYFLEVNARLQVEHPVTELVTGFDLVADQLRVAAGEKLPYSQKDVTFRGHAIECRISAEDPYNGFLPSLGHVDYVEEPSGPGVRVDSSLYSGAEIPYHYDPMLAKVICWGATRGDAVQRMLRVLQEYVIVGIQSNIPFHMQLLRDERFLRGEFHTNWLDQEFTMESPDGHPDEHVALLVAAVLAHRKRRQGARPAGGGSGPPDGSTWRFAGRDRLLASRSLTQRSGWRRSTG
jgi:acetyl-CoA carboxylase biotin carboxylase subunit